MRLFWLAFFFLTQTTNATVSGTVQDPSGARIPNAQITLENLSTGVVLANTANESGIYLFPSVQPGVYRLSAESPGFAKYVVSDLRVEAGARLEVNVPFALAAAVQTVEVTAAESPLLSVSASVGGVISGDKLVDLPLPDRDAFGVILTQPGLLGDNFGGSRIGALNVTRQGINVMDQYINSGVNSVVFNSVDVINEVRVITSPNDAEFGRGSGQVHLSERSGSNGFHGRVWNSHANSALSANNFFSNQRGDPRPGLISNDFGAGLGGPIQRRKTFFNFNYEGQRVRTATPVTATTYTDLARQGIFRFFPGVENQNADGANPTVDLDGNPVRPAGVTEKLQQINLLGRDPLRTGVDPTGTVQRLLDFMPLPNNFRYGDGLNTAGFTWRRRGSGDGNQYTLKLDQYLFNDRHQVSFSFSRQDLTSLNGFMAQTFPRSPGGTVENPATFYALNVASTFSSTKMNEFHAGSQRGRARFYAPWELGNGRSLLPTIKGQAFLPVLQLATDPLPHDSDPQGRISPLYQFGDKFTWTTGRHALKFGGEIRYRSSNGFYSFNVMPRVYFGFSDFAPDIVGVNAREIFGLVGQNEGVAQALLMDLSGAVSQVVQAFNASGGPHPTFLAEGQQRLWKQRELSLFVQDDFKLKPGFSLNLGLRYEYYGLPWDAEGRTAGLVGGSTGLFGISGTSWADRYQPGLVKGSMTRVQLIGENSENSNTTLYKPDFNNFGPTIGLSWSIPFFGKDKTILRAGYGIAFEQNALVLVDDVSGLEPGLSNEKSFSPSIYANLAGISLPLKPDVQPLEVVPLTDRSQSVFAFDNNLRTPYIQNWNLTIQRELPGRFILDLRYVGSKGTKLIRGVNVNEVNIFESQILEAFRLTQQGGNSSLLDRMFFGFFFDGLGTVNGRTVTGSQAMRFYDGTRGYFANNDVAGFADFINRVSVDGERGFLLRYAGLPENTIVVNPQFASALFVGNFSNSTYHSFQLDLNRRFSKGWTLQTNYTYSRTLGDEEGDSQFILNSFRSGRDRRIDKRLLGFHRTHVFRNSGIWDLPLGPNRTFLSGSRGLVARLVEHWRFGTIFNLFSGPPISLYSGIGTYNQFVDNTAVLVGPLPSHGRPVRTADGVTFFKGLQQVSDPSIARLTTAQQLRSRSSLKAITDESGRLIAVNPLPGSLGSLSQTALEGPGAFRLDINLIKRFQVRENMEFEIRGDAINLLNRPIFGSPDTNINSPTFGRITSAGGSRVVVLRAGVTF